MAKLQLRLSLALRIFLGFLFVICMFTILHFWSLIQLRRVGYHLGLLKRGYLPLTKLSSQLEAIKLNNKAETQKMYAIAPKKSSEELLQRLHFPPILLQKVAKSQSLLRGLKKKVTEKDLLFLRKLETYLRQIRKSLLSYEKHLHELTKHFFRKDWKTWQKSRDEFRKTELKLRRELRLLSLQVDFRLTQVVLSAERKEKNAVLILLLLLFAALVISILIFLFNIFPLRRIRKLTEMTKKIAEGDYLRRVQLPLGDEIGQLAQDFNHMTQALHQRDLDLAQRRKELESAYKDLQTSSERLLRSERLAAIGRIAAQITHEIRNPLNAIGLNLELLEEDLERLQAQEESFSVLKSSMDQVEHLTSITEDYLRLARLPKPQLESSDVNELLSELLHFLSKEMRKKEVQWELCLGDDLPCIHIDYRQIRQAILNIIRNAIEASSAFQGANAHITISSSIVGDSLAINIRDNGEGISNEKQEHIFTPFFSTKEEGSGLGLHLTQQIIQSHGGRLICESPAGQGTTFTMHLPLVGT